MPCFVFGQFWLERSEAAQRHGWIVDGSIKVTKQAMKLCCETTGKLKLRTCAGFTVQEWWWRVKQGLEHAIAP